MRSLEEIIEMNDPVYRKYRRLKAAYEAAEKARAHYRDLSNSDANGMSAKIAEASKDRWAAVDAFAEVCREVFGDAIDHS